MALYFRLDIPNIFKKHDPETTISGNDWYHSLPFERSIEIDYGKIDDTILTTSLSTRLSGRDHAGPEFELSIFGYGVRISFPKGRHWNYMKNCWLENYNVYMDKTIELAKEKYPDEEFYDYYFQKYYENGDSPEEAIENYYSEHCLSEETYHDQNNPVQDIYSQEEYIEECEEMVLEEEINLVTDYKDIFTSFYKDNLPLRLVLMTYKMIINTKEEIKK